MIHALVAERFRGFQRLEVEGFRRVNLIVGKNNCGKTALLEALVLAETRGVFLALQIARIARMRERSSLDTGFEQAWLPFFHGLRTEGGVRLRQKNDRGERLVELREDTPSLKEATFSGLKTAWKLAARTQDGDSINEEFLEFSRGELRQSGSPPVHESPPIWLLPFRHPEKIDFQFFTRLKLSQRETSIVELLRTVDPGVKGVELLSPLGEAEFYLRTDGVPPLQPLSMAGDGFQRCFEIALTLAAMEGSLLLVDEIENGLHHSVLEPLWRWLAGVASQRGVQIFATTHSEECVAAAVRAFNGPNQDDLALIRLDPRQAETCAAVYPRPLVEAAMEMAVELRG